MSQNAEVRYAYEALLDASNLTVADRLILHALGVCWTDNGCTSVCQAASSR